jgi:hypothetical protein
MEKELKVSNETARKIYPTAPDAVKLLLEENFGKDFFSGKIDTIEDILSISGKAMADIQKPGDEDDEVAYKLGKLIATVYNNKRIANGSKPLDPSDPKQYKYYPWHEVVKDDSKPSGFGLSFHVYGSWASTSAVGVRLCFIDSSDATEAGKKFIDVYDRLKIR